MLIVLGLSVEMSLSTKDSSFFFLSIEMLKIALGSSIVTEDGLV